MRWKGDWRGPKEGICRPTGGYYRIPGLGGFDNGEKWKDSRVLYILKLEELGNLTMEGEKRDSASWLLGKEVLSTGRENPEEDQDCCGRSDVFMCRLSLGALWCFREKMVSRKGSGSEVRGEVCVLTDMIIEANNKSELAQGENLKKAEVEFAVSGIPCSCGEWNLCHLFYFAFRWQSHSHLHHHEQLLIKRNSHSPLHPYTKVPIGKMKFHSFIHSFIHPFIPSLRKSFYWVYTMCQTWGIQKLGKQMSSAKALYCLRDKDLQINTSYRKIEAYAKHWAEIPAIII